MHAQQQTKHQSMPCGRPPKTTTSSIKIITTNNKLDSSRLQQQENYEAFVHSLDDRMYRRIATSRGRMQAAPLSTIVPNHGSFHGESRNPTVVADADKGNDHSLTEDTHYEEEGIFEIDL